MTKNEIVKRPASGLKERGQYAVALSLVGVMLYAAGFPVFFLLFVGVLTYFVWKIFSSEARSDVRRIFEFYLSANEILRDDYRRWYGFEIQETIAHGERIVRAIPTAPPLVHFALGALYDRLGDHSSAIRHLSFVTDNASSESDIVFPTNELRDYVRILRKIERSPAEAPQTSSAIRSLERLRKNKAKSILERNQAVEQSLELKSLQKAEGVSDSQVVNNSRGEDHAEAFSNYSPNGQAINSNSNCTDLTFSLEDNDIAMKHQDNEGRERKTISEVLHDIYDDKDPVSRTEGNLS